VLGGFEWLIGDQWVGFGCMDLGSYGSESVGGGVNVDI